MGAAFCCLNDAGVGRRKGNFPVFRIRITENQVVGLKQTGNFPVFVVTQPDPGCWVAPADGAFGIAIDPSSEQVKYCERQQGKPLP
jgi:hypothetical protein